MRELHMVHLRGITLHAYRCFANYIKERSCWGKISTVRVRDPPRWLSHRAEVQHLINAAMRCARAEHDWSVALHQYKTASSCGV